ncbi:LCP family protein required for cell wall assembly [Paenibacillus shirakamiensis]|uniref:LCP family protein required for cell wall assembly n=1 Tax=Paenibacillus shirakamiensis TaxID=1265935 RepID=A0ABS4JJR1_9BACL|nr:LCP family protein [Paenibacillus shirakamiensis]MBP2001943.1 LCP family protein required for cell wall assembly [Paenibacillus shirakamiensis]
MRRSRKILLILSSVFILFIATGYLIYYKLQPIHHFSTAPLPILVKPNHDADSEPSPSVPDSSLSGSGATSTLKGSAFNLLILGIDARDTENSRTDVIMLAHVDIAQSTVHLISIPRDTRVKLPQVGYTKINHAHVLGEIQGGNQAGTQASLQAVSNLCNCTINYYVKTNFVGFEHFINTLGGINVTLPAPVKLTYAHITLPAGDQKLNGDLALKLVQERHSLGEGDNGRQENQALMLKSIVHSLLQPSNIARFPWLVQQAKQDLLDTNLTDADIISLSLLAKNMNAQSIQYVQIPGHSGKFMDPLVHKELYYWIPNAAAWAEIRSKDL